MTLFSGYRSFQQLHAETSELFYADIPQKDACQARTRLGLLFLAGVALTIWASPTSSAAVPKIEIFPTQLSLQVGETEEGWVKIVNESDKPIDVLDLTPTVPKGMKVHVEPFVPPLPQTLPSRREMLTRFTVRASEEEPPRDPVYFIATYAWPSAKKGQGKALAKEQGSEPRTAFGELKLEARAPSDLSKLASLELSSAARSLDELHSGIIYLIVRNISNRPISLDCPQTTHPDSIEKVDINLANQSQNPKNSKNSPDNKCDTEMHLLPGENQIFELIIKPKDAASAGSHPLFISLKLHWQEGDRRASGTLIANHTVELGMFGESIILQLLMIPSFLVLPGFLLMGTWLAVHRQLMSASETKAGGTEMSTREFWIIAISLSFIAPLVYPYLTEKLGDHRRDYLQGYGLTDLMYVWAGSIFFGLILSLAKFLMWPYLRRKYFEPQLDDKPEVALRKARRSGASLAWVKLANDPTNADYFIYREKDNQIWVAPEIKYEWVDASLRGRFAANFEAMLEPTQKKSDFTWLCWISTRFCYASALSKLINDAVNRSQIRVSWVRDNTNTKRGPKGPFDKKDIQSQQERAPISA